MSYQTLRALTKERLTAATEEIFLLFERTIQEYEQELSRSKEETHRTQALLDSVLNPRVWQLQAVAETRTEPGLNHGPNQEIPESSQIKEEREEQGITQEEDHLPVALMKERLTAATEVIFSLFERTIHEYEEELSRSKEETNRTQVLLDSVLHPRVKLLQAAAETRTDHGLNHGPNQEIPGISQIKKEHSVKQEEDHLPLPEFFAVCVKTEELSAYQQTEHKEEETLGEDVSTEPHLQTETEGDTSDDEEVWGAPFSCSDDENDSNQSEPETSAALNESGTAEEAERSTQCPVCKKILKGRKRNMKRHMLIHTGERPYSCSVCNKTFNQKSVLTIHKRTHAVNKPFSCSICKKEFTQSGGLRYHMSTHTGERPYSCLVCNKRFMQKSHLNIHIRTHAVNKPFSCSICQKEFAQSGGLRYHMSSTHTGEKPFSCSTCNKTFILKSNLERHLRTQPGESTFSCSICNEDFAQRCGLKCHMKLHIEEEISCPTCNKAFTSKSNLRVHLRIHTGERPYSCAVCDKTFSHVKSLNDHRRTHTGEKPFDCPMCGKAFSTTSGLRSHIKTHTERPFS